jgi:DNA repair exonuclease SbcCD ATPase subunit
MEALMKRGPSKPLASPAALRSLFTLAVMLLGTLAMAGAALAAAGFQYALVKRDHETSCAVSGRNNWRTIGKLQDEVERTGREVLYFAIDDKEYVVRDPAVVERAGEIVEPVSRLGAEQGRLGGMQGDLGRRQGELGQLQGEVAQVQAHLASLEARDYDRHRAELDELHQQLRELSAQVRSLAERQRELGAQQQELGRRQAELGEQQGRATKLAFEQIRSLADKAIAGGKAEAIGSE